MTITKSKESYYKLSVVCKIIGIVCCVLPALIAGIVELPIVKNKDARTTLSACFIIVLIICALPIYKLLRDQLKKGTTAVFMWVIVLVFFLIRKVPEDVLTGIYIVSLASAIGNTIGAFLFLFSNQMKSKGLFIENNS